MIQPVFFEAAKPLSFYTLGNSDPSYHVVWLHGVGGSAEGSKRTATALSKLLPHASLTVINGREDISQAILALDPEPDPDSNFCFSWYGEKCVGKAHDDVATIINGLQADPARVVVCGFSQGGFVAADVVCHHPDVARHAILHSSALIGSYKKAAKAVAKPCSFDTLLSVDDPYLRTPMVLGIFKHYWASLLFQKQGHKTNTRFSHGFGHDVSPKSLAITAQTIKHRLGVVQL